MPSPRPTSPVAALRAAAAPLPSNHGTCSGMATAPECVLVHCMCLQRVTRVLKSLHGYGGSTARAIVAALSSTTVKPEGVGRGPRPCHIENGAREPRGAMRAAGAIGDSIGVWRARRLRGREELASRREPSYPFVSLLLSARAKSC